MTGARQFRLEWSHKPTPIPTESAGLWYSEECAEQLMEAYAQHCVAQREAEIARLRQELRRIVEYLPEEHGKEWNPLDAYLHVKQIARDALAAAPLPPQEENV